MSRKNKRLAYVRPLPNAFNSSRPKFRTSWTRPANVARTSSAIRRKSYVNM